MACASGGDGGGKGSGGCGGGGGGEGGRGGKGGGAHGSTESSNEKAGSVPPEEDLFGCGRGREPSLKLTSHPCSFELLPTVSSQAAEGSLSESASKEMRAQPPSALSCMSSGL